MYGHMDYEYYNYSTVLVPTNLATVVASYV